MHAQVQATLPMEKQRRALDKGLPPKTKKPQKQAAAVVPVAALQQFLAALRNKDFEGAKVLAFRILTDEPDNETVRMCLPEIDRQLQRQEADDEDEDGEEEDGEEEDGEEDGEDEGEGGEEDDEDDEDDEEGEGEDGGAAAQPVNPEEEAAATAARLEQLMLSGRDAELKGSLRSLVQTLVPD